jgi:hypothetical protein
MPENVVVGGEPAAGNRNQMEAVYLQVFHQRVKVLGDGAGLRTSVGLRRAAAPSTPVESDGAIAGRDEAWNIVLPTISVARVGVEQQDRDAGTAAVGVPEAHAGQIRVAGELCSRCHNHLSRAKPNSKSEYRSPKQTEEKTNLKWDKSKTPNSQKLVWHIPIFVF